MRLPARDAVVLDRSESPSGRAAVRLLRQLGARIEEAPPRAPVDIVLTGSGGALTRVGARVVVTLADRDDVPLLPAEVVAELTGAHAAVAALGALRWSRRKGRPARVAVDALDVAVSCFGTIVPRLTCTRRQAAGPAADSPPTVARCADGFVTVAALTDLDRAALAAAAGAPAVPEGERGLQRLVEERFGGLRRDELVELCQLWRIPVLPVLAPEEVFAEHDGGGPVRAVSRGFRPKPAVPGPLPLSDVIALDLGMVWAGPYCSRLLAGLGARVVKVEGPARPDGTRPRRDRDCWGLFGDLNRDKESVVLDLGLPEGREVFLQLAAAADVVVENFSPRVLPNFGLDDAVLRGASPSILFLSMPAFGPGRRGAFVGYGSGVELAAGLGLTAPDGCPAPAGVPYLDFLNGCYGAAAVLSALLERDRSGSGARLEIAQWDVACSLLEANGFRPPWPARGDLDAALGEASPLLSHGTPPSEGSCHHYVRLPWRSSLPAPPGRAAPGFGHDSRRVLTTLGSLSSEAVDSLAARRVIVEGKS